MSEDDAIDFGLLSEIDAEAIGRPGERRFRIRILNGDSSCSLYLEKQQLQVLYLGIKQLLEEHGIDAPSALPYLPIEDFPAPPVIDFQVGHLGLGWDEHERQFTIMARPISPSAGISSFRCCLDVPQAFAFCDLAEAVCAAGRPVCPLCLEPIDPGGHTCLRSNGHYKDRGLPQDG